jgi:uncharacterized protein DUF5337
MEPSLEQDSNVKQARLAAIVILLTFPAWMGFSYYGGKVGLDPSYAILGDLAALAAFAWSMVVLYRVWRNGQQDKD